MLDGGKGLDLTVSESEEVQFAFAPYDIRSRRGLGTTNAGFGDWAFVRLKQRIASSPVDDGDYVLTTWLQIQAPTGIKAFTNDSWTFLPTIAFGKGWGAFDIQGTLGGVIPTDHVGTLGHQLQGNLALQYNIDGIFWPELEANWTYYPDGQRRGLNQVFLTPGLTLARFHLSSVTTLRVGAGYQVAIAPKYRPTPSTPTYHDAVLISSRINF